MKLVFPFFLLLSSCHLLGIKSVDMSIEARERAHQLMKQGEDDEFQVHYKRPGPSI